MISCITFIVSLHSHGVEYLQYANKIRGGLVNRNSIFIGLFLAVFVFPTNNSLVFAKSCKDQKSDLRAEKKAVIRSLCEGKILPQLDKLTKHTLNGHENARFCRGGDWSVKTNPKGGCGKQKDHIRTRYNNKIASLEAFVVDTQNAVLAAERELRQLQIAEQKRVAAEKAEQERLAAEKAEKAEALRPKLIEAGLGAGGRYPVSSLLRLQSRNLRRAAFPVVRR